MSKEIVDFVRNIVNRYTLPPNMVLGFQDHSNLELIVLTVTGTWRDATGVQEEVLTTQSSSLPYMHLAIRYREFMLKTTIEMLVQSVWQHELNEWFKFDEKYVQDPHPEHNREVVSACAYCGTALHRAADGTMVDDTDGDCCWGDENFRNENQPHRLVAENTNAIMRRHSKEKL